jgi:tRNA(Ile)-lysidine synthase
MSRPSPLDAIDPALFRRTKSVLAAVSGGPDSVALLIVLQELAAALGFALTAAHFDHQLRDSSRDDLQWVKKLCEERGITFLSGEGDVREVAGRQKLGIEETARRMRYQFLAFAAGQKGIDAIATGHTADDQAETVLMRVIRGSGVRGIRGMLPISTVPGGSQKLIRPLLELSRDDTLAVCAEAGITPLVDATNAEPGPLRNRVRHEILPALRAINPSVKDALRQLAANAAEAFEPIERQAMEVQPERRGPIGALFRVETIANLPSEALVLLIEREGAFYRLKPEVNATRLRDVRNVLESGSGSALFGQVEAEASCGQVRIGPPLEPVEPFDAKVLNVPGVTVAGPWRVTVSTSPLAEAAGGERCTVNLDGLAGALRVRPLRSGDRMRFQSIERSVKGVLANTRIPRWDRQGAIAIADSAHVHAVLVPGAVIEADRPPDADVLHVQLAPATKK